MDDNPWGNPTPATSEQATPAPVSPVVLPSVGSDEVPAWEAQPSPPEGAQSSTELGQEEEEPEVNKEDDGLAPMAVEGEEQAGPQEPVDVDESVHEPTAALTEDHTTDHSATPNVQLQNDTSRDGEAEAQPDAAVSQDNPVVASPSAVADAPNPTDSTPTPTPAADDAFDDDGFGDDDEFGEMGGDNAGDDDFGDFGDFDEGSGGFEEAQFDPPPAPAPVPAPAPPPVASTSGLPPLNLDWSKPTRKGLGPQLEEWFEEVYAGAGESMTDEQERQVDGVGQVLVNKQL